MYLEIYLLTEFRKNFYYYFIIHNLNYKWKKAIVFSSLYFLHAKFIDVFWQTLTLTLYKKYLNAVNKNKFNL